MNECQVEDCNNVFADVGFYVFVRDKNGKMKRLSTCYQCFVKANKGHTKEFTLGHELAEHTKEKKHCSMCAACIDDCQYEVIQKKDKKAMSLCRACYEAHKDDLVYLSGMFKVSKKSERNISFKSEHLCIPIDHPNIKEIAYQIYKDALDNNYWTEENSIWMNKAIPGIAEYICKRIIEDNETK